MYKCVLFDLDGTIADTDLLVIEAYHMLFKKYRPEYKPTLKELAALSGPTLYDSIRKYFPNEDVNKLIDNFRDLSTPMYKTFACLYPGTLEMMSFLKSKGIKIGIVTSKLRSATEQTLDLYGLRDYVEFCVCSDEVSAPKPNPEGIYKALEFFKMNNNDTLFVGDSYSDEKAAHNAFVDCCLVTWNLRGLLPNTNPKYVAHNYQELNEVIFNGSN